MKRKMKWLSFLLLSIFMLAGCNGSGVGYHYDEASSYKMGGTQISDPIREIDVNWISGSVSVKYHDGAKIVIEEASSKELDKNTSLYYRVKGDTLDIQFAKSGKLSDANFSKNLTILLPKTMQNAEEALRSLSVETVSASIFADGIYTRECDAETVSGKIDLNLAGTIDEVSIETVSGNAVLGAHDGLRDLDINSVSGNVQVGLHDSAVFGVEFESVSGKLGGDFLFIKTNGVFVTGKGGPEYEANTVSGDLTFLKLK